MKPIPNFLETIKSLSHDLPVNEALEMYNRLLANREKVLEPTERGKGLIFISETFNKDAINTVLSQPKAAAFRTYLGMDVEKRLVVMFVGVNDKGEDIINSGGTIIDNPFIAETGQRFP